MYTRFLHDVLRGWVLKPFTEISIKFTGEPQMRKSEIQSWFRRLFNQTDAYKSHERVNKTSGRWSLYWLIHVLFTNRKHPTYLTLSVSKKKIPWCTLRLQVLNIYLQKEVERILFLGWRPKSGSPKRASILNPCTRFRGSIRSIFMTLYEIIGCIHICTLLNSKANRP